MGKSPSPTYGRNFVKGKNSFAVLLYGYFNLIARETLRKILGDCIEWKSHQIVIVAYCLGFCAKFVFHGLRWDPFSKLARVR